MTEQELQAMQARADAATPGPWVETPSRVCSKAVDYGPHSPGLSLANSNGLMKREDVAFIAHAHADVPALIAEVRRLQAEVKLASEIMTCNVKTMEDQAVELAELKAINAVHLDQLATYLAKLDGSYRED